MSVLSKLVGTFSTFQFGKNGVKVKTTSNALSVRDASDANPAAIITSSALLGTSTGNAVLKAPNAAEVNIRNAADSADAKLTLLSMVLNGQATVKTTGAAALAFRDSTDSSDASISAGQINTSTGGVHFDTHGFIKDGGSDGVLLVVLEDGSTAGNLRVGAPSNGNDAVNLTYFNSNTSSSALQIRGQSIRSGTYAATYTGATFIPDNATITRCVVDVVGALQDSGSSAVNVKVGTDEAGQDARFQAYTDNDTQTVGTYETTPFVMMKSGAPSGSTQKFLITCSALPASGTVNIYIEYVVPQAL
jgi:hypothetical protein